MNESLLDTRNSHREINPRLQSILSMIIGATLLLGGLFGVLISPVIVPSPSMAPTIAVGEVVWVWKAPYSVGLGNPGRGDIVTFDAPKSSQHLVNLFIKRVVAIAGDTVEIRHNRLVLNGNLLPLQINEKLQHMEVLDGRTHYKVNLDRGGAKFDMPAMTVPQGHVFILGDNRGNSEDSRKWGPVPINSLKGVALKR